MYTRRSSNLRTASKKSAHESPSPNEDVLQRRLTSKRHRTWLREADVGVFNTDEGSGLDIIDLINRKHDAAHVMVEDDGKFVEVADKGVDGSDEDCGSDNSSIVSGPSLLHASCTKKLKPSQRLCSACQKLYQKAKKTKASIKDRLLENSKCTQALFTQHAHHRNLKTSATVHQRKDAQLCNCESQNSKTMSLNKVLIPLLQ